MIRFEITQIPSTRLKDLLDEAPCGFVPMNSVTPIMDDDICMLLGRDHTNTDNCQFISLDDGCNGVLPGDTMVVPMDLVVKAEPA